MPNWSSFDRRAKLMEDLSSRTLAAIPSEYGRLIYLASLRDLGSGAYAHAGLEKLYPQWAVQEALSKAHNEVCQRILETPLARQEMDLRFCLRGFDADPAEVISQWRELESYRALLPAGMPAYIRKLFCSNFETLLTVLADDAASGRQAA
jgi:hypothetical protein